MWLFRPSQSGIARYLPWRNCAAILASALASMDMIAGDLAMAGITAATSQSPLHATYPVGLSADKRYLVDPNNHPVFIVGESAWALVTQLSDSDVDLYLSDRASRGFNVIWVAAVDNASQANPPFDHYGNAPFNGADFTTENPAYWAHVDHVLQRAAANGIAVLLSPAFVGLTYSEGYLGSYESSSDAIMTEYGAWLGARYRNYPNVIWALGGDADPANIIVYRKLSLLADGIRSADPRHLITFEASRLSNGKRVPNGGYSSLDVWSGPPSWLDLNWVYLRPDYIPSAVTTNYFRSPWLPPLLGEDWYEGEHPMTELQVRQEGYNAVLGGAYLGRIFGNGEIWRFGSPIRDSSQQSWRSRLAGVLRRILRLNATSTVEQSWQSQLGSSGSVGQANLGALFVSREHWKLVPDANHAVMTAGYETGDTLAVAARTSDGQTIIAYLPTQRTVTIDMTNISDVLAKGWWFNPRTGAATLIGKYATAGSPTFTPPDRNDWVLVIDGASAQVPPPGGPRL